MDGDKTEKVFLLLKQQFSWLASQQAVGSCINRATDLKEHPDAILGKSAVVEHEGGYGEMLVSA